MKPIWNTLTCALLLVPAFGPAWSQLGEHPEPYHQLTWKDFRIDDSAPAEQDTAATTASRIGYEYQMRWSGRPGAYTAAITQMRITSEFDPARSWRRSHLGSDPARLLQHEQGHLDINEIFANRMRQIPLSAWPTGSGATPQAAMDDLNRKIKAYFDQSLAQEQKYQETYDRETGHSKLAAKQQLWTKHIQQLLHESMTARR